jgi:hypothetical protein
MNDFHVYIFSYDFCKFYANLSLLLFITPLMNFPATTCAPYGFALLSSISGRVNLILEDCLLGELDLIMCRRLNSKSEK